MAARVRDNASVPAGYHEATERIVLGLAVKVRKSFTMLRARNPEKLLRADVDSKVPSTVTEGQRCAVLRWRVKASVL